MSSHRDDPSRPASPGPRSRRPRGAGDPPADAPHAGHGADPAVGVPGGFVRPDLPLLASTMRRLVGLGIDWLAAVAISAGFFQYDPLATLVIFFVMTTVLVGTLGATIGHVVMGLGVRQAQGVPPGPLKALIRTVLLCLFIPPVIWGPDNRGLHDMLAGTTITRLRAA